MKKILVAFDFSSTAQNALDYALHLAADFGASVELVHTYTVAVPPTDGQATLVQSNNMVVNNYEDQLQKELNRLNAINTHNVPVDSALVLGDVFEILSERISEGNVWLTVMGTTGENSSGTFWGSKSMKALRELNGPVLIVPKNAQYKKINSVLLTADLQHMDKHFPFEEVKSWIRNIDANLDVLNIQPLDAFMDEGMLTSIPNFGDIKHTFHNVEDGNISEAISYYLEKKPADWIIVVPKKYNFFENLFHKSKSEMITKASDVPVLAIHQ